MSCAIYRINNNWRINCCFLVPPGMDLFNHAFHICCPVNSVLGAKDHRLTHYLYVIDPGKFFNVLKLIPYIPWFIMPYLKKVFFSLIRIGELRG